MKEKPKFMGSLKQRENYHWTKKWHNIYLWWSILRQKKWEKLERIRFTEMIHEYPTHEESSHMPGAGTECKTFLESHGWNNFVFPCMNGPSYSSGQHSSPQWVIKNITKRDFWHHHKSILHWCQALLSFIFSHMGSEFYTVMTSNPWNLWAGASRPNQPRIQTAQRQYENTSVHFILCWSLMQV